MVAIACAYTEKVMFGSARIKKLPQLCQQLATGSMAIAWLANDDREQRLYRMLRTGNNGDIATLPADWACR